MVSSTTRFALIAIDGIAEPDEESFQVVLASLLDLAALDVHVIDGEFAVLLQLLEIVAKRGDVLGEVFLGLLEGHEYAGFAVVEDAVDEELHPENRLARSGAAAHQRGASRGQTALRDLIETFNAGRSLV